jgi:hypothetical protein
MCAICGNSGNIHMHHCNPLKYRGGRYTGFREFDLLLAALNRKQIPICEHCHMKIHRGEYDGISPYELHDVRLVTPETHLNTGQNTGQKQSKSGDEKKLIKSIVINEQAKTYFNSLHYNYYQLIRYEKNKNPATI